MEDSALYVALKSDLTNYRLIALTSQIGKMMERMVTERITYYLEKRNYLSLYQNACHKGRNMDLVLILESEIRKSQINKQIVVAVFFDIEKAYDMLWKEGKLGVGGRCVMTCYGKLCKLGVGGRLYNWVVDFL